MNPFLVLYLVALVVIVVSAVWAFFIVGWKVFVSVLTATAVATAILVILEEWIER